MPRRRRKGRRKSPSAPKLGRASNPLLPWLHGLAARGDERWEEAITSLRRFLEMGEEPEDRRQAST